MAVIINYRSSALEQSMTNYWGLKSEIYVYFRPKVLSSYILQCMNIPEKQISVFILINAPSLIRAPCHSSGKRVAKCHIKCLKNIEILVYLPIQCILSLEHLCIRLVIAAPPGAFIKINTDVMVGGYFMIIEG